MKSFSALVGKHHASVGRRHGARLQSFLLAAAASDGPGSGSTTCGLVGCCTSRAVGSMQSADTVDDAAGGWSFVCLFVYLSGMVWYGIVWYGMV